MPLASRGPGLDPPRLSAAADLGFGDPGLDLGRMRPAVTAASTETFAVTPSSRTPLGGILRAAHNLGRSPPPSTATSEVSRGYGSHQQQHSCFHSFGDSLNCPVPPRHTTTTGELGAKAPERARSWGRGSSGREPWAATKETAAVVAGAIQRGHSTRQNRLPASRPRLADVAAVAAEITAAMLPRNSASTPLASAAPTSAVAAANLATWATVSLQAA